MTKHNFKADPSDFVIVIMGPTGSGKTNFINTLTGDTEQRRAGKLRSDTQDVTPYPILFHGARVVLVDTPGFDDTYRPDSEILRVVANWLTQKYPDGTTLLASGIIYLHRISDNRMSGSVYKNLQLFGRLCGNIPLRRARLVTTMWDKAKNQAIAENRETELKGEFWRKLLQEGAEARRFENTQDSARNIVRELIGPRKGDELLLQEELVGQKKRLNETEAAKVLYGRFQKLLAEQRNTLKELADEAKLANDPALAKNLQEEYDRVNTQLQETFKEMRVMKFNISFFRNIYLSVFGRKPRARAVELET